MVKAELLLKHNPNAPLVLLPATDKVRLLVRDLVANGVQVHVCSPVLDSLYVLSTAGRLQMSALYRVIRLWLVETFGVTAASKITIKRRPNHARNRTVVQN